VSCNLTVHTECTVAFSLQQCLHKSATLLHHMYIAYLLLVQFVNKNLCEDYFHWYDVSIFI